MRPTAVAFTHLAVLLASSFSPAEQGVTLLGPTPSADAIMSRVAVNQDRADVARRHFVYVQHARVLSRRGGTIMCEEVTDQRITPSESGVHASLLKLDGRIRHAGQYLTYNTLKSSDDNQDSHTEHTDNKVSIEVDDGLDRDLVENMRSNLINDKSRDGLGAHLFPLTSANQAEYLFHLLGVERLNGHEVFHLEFWPKDKSDYGWKGNAFIDTTDFQPVVVSTTMARKLPFAVRTLLGTSLPGLGFTVVYAPQTDGIWFPISFGTEFKLHVLFFFRREIIIDAKNLNFERTHVTSTILDPKEPNSQQ